MIRRTRIFTRPNTNVPFYLEDAEFRAYMKTTYIDTKLRVSFSRSNSSAGLVETIVTVWRDQAAHDTWNSDSIVINQYNKRKEYNLANNIIENSVSFETV